ERFLIAGSISLSVFQVNSFLSGVLCCWVGIVGKDELTGGAFSSLVALRALIRKTTRERITTR
ncbi:MAG TPA: hypothetical protein PLS50_02580, partial [Candidatus Dojkabacteria bacterium]|nr:hypothetical protein [Candidatus Dojkabacteria bacterium]